MRKRRSKPDVFVRFSGQTDFTQFDIYYIDLFCGAGGTTTGLEQAVDEYGNKIACGLACVNHDANAIRSHEYNHPHILHFIEDIRTIDLKPMVELVNEVRRQNPKAVIILWASLECTNFSNAKGGAPRDADSRTLAEHLIESEDANGVMQPRYIPLLNPDCVWIENVKEFKSWGPLDDKGKPISKEKGVDFVKWVNNVKSYGFELEHCMINAADLGAYTSRNRLFMQFNKPGISIAWPEQTHAKNPEKYELGKFKKWRAVRDILQLDEHGKTIFGRKKDLSDKTFERFFHGAVKQIAGGKHNYKTVRALYYGVRYIAAQPYVLTIDSTELGQSFMIKYLSAQSNVSVVSCNQSIDEPSCTITTHNRYAIATAQFVDTYFGRGYVNSIDKPISTVTTKDRHSLVTPYVWIQSYQGKPDSHIHSVDKPSPVLLAGKDKKVVSATAFIYRDLRSGYYNSLDSAVGALTTVPKINLVTPVPWLMDTQFNNVGSSISEPAKTLTASRKMFYLINPQWGVNGNRSIEEPCFTLIARQDKAPAHLIEVEAGHVAIVVNETDGPWQRRLKEFMAIFGISDMKMRMLFIKEKLQIQGFPADYILVGTQTEQNKFIGNSVHTIVAKLWMEAFYRANFSNQKLKAA